MKISLLAFLFITSNICYAQSISDYFGIKEISQIEVVFSPDMDTDKSNNSVVKTSADHSFITEIGALLSQLPASGSIHKSFPKSIPSWSIQVIHQENKTHQLIFYGMKLRAPDSSKGTYYVGADIGKIEKKLYLALRSFMLGDWYNCD